MTPPAAWKIGCLALALCACERNDPSAEPSEPRPPPATSAARRQALADAAAQIALDGPSEAATSAVLRVREALPLSPRTFPSQAVVFGRARLAVLAQQELVVREASTLAVSAHISMAEPRRLVALADGALLAAGRDATYLVARHEKSAQLLPKLTLFPDSVLFADRRDPRRVWVLHPAARSLYDYSIEPGNDAGLLSIARFVKLEAFSGRALVGLADGSFAYLTDSGLRRFFPEGRSWRFELPGVSDARLERARRTDELWWTPSDGSLERLSLVGKLRRLQRLELGTAVFDLAIEGDSIAFIAQDRSPGQARRFRLVLLAADGTRRFEQPLTADPATTDDDWARSVTRNLHLALAPDARSVAVGGAERLDVWEVPSGRRLGP